MERSLKIKEFKFPSYTKYYIAIDFNNLESSKEVLVKYGEIFRFIDYHKITPIYEKIFGRLDFLKEVLMVRERYLNNLNLKIPPLSYVEGIPVSGNPISSTLIYGISTTAENIKIDYYQDSENGATIGTVVQTPNSKYLYLNGLRIPNYSSLTPDIEFKSLFKALNGHLKENGFTAEDIVRTWIYLNHINKTYADFNTARREFFEENQIEYAANSIELPASTCIGGKSAEESEMSINLTCIDKKINHPMIKRLYNKFQNEAEGSSYLFKPAFSRALVIEDEDLIELQVSGTASINESGETVYLGDSRNQIKKTLTNVSALLEQADMNFSDFCEATCFFKQKEYYTDFLAVVKELNIGDFSNTFVIGEVCRDNLLFELDGIAIKQR